MSLAATDARTFSQALAQALIRHTDHTFGLMGNGNAHLIDGYSGTGMRVVEVRHEAGAVAAADAFTRVSGRLAVATATYGAGFTNTLTALAEAQMARTPMLVVVGDAPQSGPRPWDVNQEQLASAIGVETVVLTLEHFDMQVDQAAARALQERRPIVLSIPYDLVALTISADSDTATTSTVAAHSAATVSLQKSSPASAEMLSLSEELLSVDKLEFAISALAQAKRPAIIAGRGAWLADIGNELGEIADLIGAVTASTALGRGIFPDSRFDLGLTGGFGSDAAMAVLGEADVVLVVGASLNQFTMRFGELFSAGTTVIRIDTDHVAAPRTAHKVSHQLLRGDARAIVPSLITGIQNQPRSANVSTRWRETLTGFEPGGSLRMLNDGRTEHPDGVCADGLLDPRTVAAYLADLLPEDRHVTSDGGHFIGWANMFWPVTSPERMTMVGTAYQTIGLGFSTVAGVAAAAPDSTVVLTTGDGGGLMALADLETAIRTAARCVIVVWNDSAYGAEVHLYGAMGLDQTSMLMPEVNFAQLAQALGATGVTVNRLSDLDALGDWTQAGGTGTILLDCRVSRSVVAPYQVEIQRVNGVFVDHE